MKKLKSYEKQLAKLRQRHRDLFTSEKWIEMQTCGSKITTLLDAITKHFPEWKEADTGEGSATK